MAKKRFLYENVYNDLKQKIECGDLKPGDKLEVEEDMIAHYGVSAITVKKALCISIRYQFNRIPSFFQSKKHLFCTVDQFAALYDR